jgi:hypothetical protein
MHRSEISITRAQPDKRNANESGGGGVSDFSHLTGRIYIILRSVAGGGV